MARIAMMVKKNKVNLQRVKEIEDPYTSAMWFKLKLPSKTIMMAAWYRQWNHLEDVAPNRTGGVEGQIECINSMKNQVEKAKAISKKILIIEDTNLDMSEDKD